MEQAWVQKMYTCVICGIELSKESLDGKLQMRGQQKIACQVCRVMLNAVNKPWFQKAHEEYLEELAVMTARKRMLLSEGWQES
jgi:DNA-directed RNA polymerase subunit RPC12/RpoP